MERGRWPRWYDRASVRRWSRRWSRFSCFEPVPPYAQAAAAPQEIRARKFILVDGTGVARGVFGIEENGTPQIEVIGYNGHVYATVFRSWSRWDTDSWRSLLAKGPKKPTLLPIKP
jgi:hypothetical protein